MPAKSQAQQRYFGMLYAKNKTGDTTGLSEKDIKTMGSMDSKQLRDFAATKRKSLPVTIQKAAGFYSVRKKDDASPWANAMVYGDEGMKKEVRMPYLKNSIYSIDEDNNGVTYNISSFYKKPWYRRAPKPSDIGNKYKLITSDVIVPINKEKASAALKKGGPTAVKSMASDKNPTESIAVYAPPPLMFGRRKYKEMITNPIVRRHIPTDEQIYDVKDDVISSIALNKSPSKLYDEKKARPSSIDKILEKEASAMSVSATKRKSLPAVIRKEAVSAEYALKVMKNSPKYGDAIPLLVGRSEYISKLQRTMPRPIDMSLESIKVLNKAIKPTPILPKHPLVENRIVNAITSAINNNRFNKMKEVAREV